MLNRRDLVVGGVVGTVLGGSVAVPGAAKEDAEAAHAPHRLNVEDTPFADIHLHLCAFHVAKKDPANQVESHHYCMPLADDIHQCIITDDSKRGCRIIGIEYIISNSLYQGLDAKEKEYWHPHVYEVTSGLLVASHMSEADENALMKGLITTWGKTWHVWPDLKTKLPVGEPLLQWAFTADGQIRPDLVKARDAKMKIDTQAVKKRRKEAGIG